MISSAFRRIALAAAGFSLFLPALAQTARQTPTVTVTTSLPAVTTAQPLSVTVDVAGSPAPTGTVMLSSGSYSLPPMVPYVMPPLNGIYFPSLTLSNLANATGLTSSTATYVNGSGAVQGSATGIRAAVAGQAGTASIAIPHTFDITQPARIDVHVCIGSSTTASDNNQLQIYLSNGASAANGLYFSVGMNSMQLQMWGKPELENYPSGSDSSGIPSGTCGSIFLDWLGTGPGGVDGQGNEQVWAGWIPDNPTDLKAPNHTAIPSTYQPTALGFSAVLTPSMLSNLSEIYISDASANTMVTGVYVSQGRLDGPVDGAMPVPGLVQPVVLDAGNIIPSYQSNEVWIPPTYGNPDGNPIVQTYHPNGTVADITYGREGIYANLLNAGYILVAVTGDNGYGYSAWNGPYYSCSPTSSSWGGPSGGQYRNAAMGLVRHYLPNGNQYFRIGLSAGAADALNDEIRNPGSSGIAIYSGVISLTEAWNQAGQPDPAAGTSPESTYSSFLPNIQYGWGDWYLSLLGNNTDEAPNSSPSYWKKISSTLTGLPLSYFNATEYTQKGAWSQTATYNANDIAVLPYSGDISGLAAGDPGSNYSKFTKVPIQAWTEQNDSTIMSPEWQTAFISGVTAAGNTNAISNILTDCPVGGGCHVSPGVFNPTNNQPWNITTNPSPTLAWFNSLRTPWSVPATGSYNGAAALSSGSATLGIPAGSLPVGVDTLTATYIPDSASSSAFLSSTGSASVTVTSAAPITPSVAVKLSSASVTVAQAITITVTVGGGNGNPATTGTVTLLDGTSQLVTEPLGSSGLVSYSASGLSLGSHSIAASYSGDSNYAAASSPAVSLTVTQATPNINWPQPSPIAYGSALGAAQLDASSLTPGTFSYSPAAGTVLGAGSQQLQVTFTPTDTTDYTTATASVTILVNPALLTVTAQSASRTYGAANPALSAAITGFVNGDTAASAVSGSPSLATTATAKSAVGTYPITVSAGTLAAANYTFAFAVGTLTVSKAQLTVTATNSAVTYNQPIPKLAFSIAGYVNSETASVVSGAPVESTTAKQGSAVGIYPITITQGTLAAGNYSFLMQNGSLTINPLGITATPAFKPAAGSYASAQSVIMTDATTGATIYYTTDGTAPTTASAKYTAAIEVTATETINAIAVAAGYTQSAIGTAAYAIVPPAPTPTFAPAAGTYATTQSVAIGDAASGATIYYTTNGSTPATSSAVYSAAIAVTATETIKAIASGGGYSASAVASATYTIAPPAAAPVFSIAAGNYTAAQTVKITDATAGATIYYTTNGAAPTTSSTKYTAPISVAATETLSAMATATGHSASPVASAAYTITLPAATPTFSPAAGSYTSAQSVKIGDATAGAAIYYTTDGSAPSAASATYTAPIPVGTSETIHAIALAAGYSQSATATAKYTITLPTATPVFSLAAGTYAGTQQVTITDATQGATIYYTTNGSTPSGSSIKYTAAVSVAATETLKAIALATGYTQSAVASAAYTIAPVTATPTITTTAAQNGAVVVKLASATPGATILYTLDGSTPGSKSQVYEAPFLVASNLTVNAVAASGGHANSPVASQTFAPNIPSGTLVWSDEFTNSGSANTQPNPGVWTYNTGAGGWGNKELETYCAWGFSTGPCTVASPNAYVAPGSVDGGDGALHIVARNPSPNVYTSARMLSQGLFSFQYGRLEVRAQVPEGQGFWPAIWLLGNNITTVSWPACGEQDMVERIDAAASPDWNAGSVHGTGFTGANLGTDYYFPNGQTAAGWHTYGMIWSKGSVAYYVDSPTNIYATYTPASIASFSGSVWPFDTGDAFLILNVAVGGSWPGSPNSTTKFPSQMVVDYVRIYTN
jgi:beta-glucanase (GH16 family)